MDKPLEIETNKKSLGPPPGFEENNLWRKTKSRNLAFGFKNNGFHAETKIIINNPVQFYFYDMKLIDDTEEINRTNDIDDQKMNEFIEEKEDKVAENEWNLVKGGNEKKREDEYLNNFLDNSSSEIRTIRDILTDKYKTIKIHQARIQHFRYDEKMSSSDNAYNKLNSLLADRNYTVKIHFKHHDTYKRILFIFDDPEIQAVYSSNLYDCFGDYKKA